MDSTAKLKYIRQSPSKIRFVLKEIKGLKVEAAINKLSVTNKKASLFLLKTLKSAINNYTQQNPENDSDRLYIKQVFVDEGPTFKRFRPAAMGRSVPIRKRTSHLTIIVSDEKYLGGN